MYLISPVLYYTQFTLFHALEPQDLTFASFERINARQYPKSIHLLSAILHVLSGFIVFYLSRLHRQPKAQAITWICLAVGLGLPALCSFVLLTPWHVTKRLFVRKHKSSNSSTSALAH